MGSIVIPISETKQIATPMKKENKYKIGMSQILCYIKEKRSNIKVTDMKKFIHSIKVGIALVLVSLLYLLNPLYEQVGDNAMWAIMTVVVVFEFFAGATLSKGLNRGLGTIVGGGLGCLAAILAQHVGGIGNSIIVSCSVFFFGAAATYTRLIPRIKKRYDYGAMIFILTFNLIVVSGLRAEKVLELAKERLSTIAMGFGVCVFISLLVFPTWASDELHDSTASKFNDLACSIEGCLEEYFNGDDDNEKEKQPTNGIFIDCCKSVLNSKSKDELLANFAKWEPWHGKFGLFYPWQKYLQIGELLSELASTIISLRACLQSATQLSSSPSDWIKEPCEAVGSSVIESLREIGDSVMKMRKCEAEEVIVPKLKSRRADQLSKIISLSKIGPLMENNVDGLAIASFVFLLMQIIEKVENLSKEVEELGEIAGFHEN